MTGRSKREAVTNRRTVRLPGTKTKNKTQNAGKKDRKKATRKGRRGKRKGVSFVSHSLSIL